MAPKEDLLNVYLYGASGHAKVIIEVLEQLGIKPTGLFDDNEAITDMLGYKVTSYKLYTPKHSDRIIISIGNNAIRYRLVQELVASYTTAIHPFSSISKRCSIQDGTVIMSGVSINSSVEIGSHCIINTNASIDHDCRIGNFVHISPNAVLCGEVKIGEGTHIGAGATLIPGIKVGAWSTIGAGAVVIKDVPDNVKVVGNPCRQIFKNVIP
jgi:acetyltransferase EpsM